MRLERLRLHRMPGIESGFTLERLAPGLNLVVGPNGSGKSSMARALQATLWPGRFGIEGAEVESTWRLDADEGGEAGRPLEARLTVGTQWRQAGEDVPAPPLPAEHLAPAYLLGLKDLLADRGADDIRLADEIRVQLSGGYDLAALRSSIRPAYHGRKSESELVAAERALRTLQGERRDLAAEQDAMLDLRERLAEARAAHHEADALRRCIALCGLREQAVELELLLDALCVPAVELARLSGDELESLDRLDEERAELAADDTAVLARMGDVDREMARAALPAGAADPAELATWRSRARDLERRASRLGDREEEAARAEAARAAAARALAGEGTDVETAAEASLSATELDRLEQALSRVLTLRERRVVLDVRIAECRERESGAEGDGAAERVSRAADLLREWLRLGEARSAWLLLALALLACACLAGLAWTIVRAPGLGPAAGGLAGALVALCAASLVRRVRARRARRALARRFDAERVGALEGEDVRGQLSALEARAVRVADAARARSERRVLLAQRDALDDAEQALLRDRQQLDCWLGTRSALGPLSLADWLDRVRRWRESDARARAAAGLYADRSARVDEGLAELGEWLEHRSGTRPADVPEAIALLDALERRSRRLCELAVLRDAAAREREALRARDDRLGAQRRRLLEAAGVADALDPRSELARRLQDVPAHREALEALRELGARIRGLEEQLEGIREAGRLRRLNRIDAEQRLAEATLRAAGADALAEQIGAIEERARAAGESGALEERRARARRARDEMLERRREVALALAGDWLLADVEAEYEEAGRPKVLRRAAALFAAFTQGRLELVSPGVGTSGGLRARDVASGAERALHELSDGTRTQLLLAARLAFASVEERGARPPLVLDEALTATDPERFEAVAAAVLSMVASGRQVFYLTCDPADVALFARAARAAGAEPPHVLDLGRVRRGRSVPAPAGDAHGPSPGPPA